MIKLPILAILILVVGLMTAVPGVAFAVTDCTFTIEDTTMTLEADRTTDQTILIPDGFTLDGNGFSITAVDPSGGHFLGAVVKNAGSSAHVTGLTITTDALANVCDGGANRLRGIMFEGASGSITHNTVLDINQGLSGCQEGNAIEVRKSPFDRTHPDTATVTVSHNTIESFQKTGIVANGDVNVIVEHNSITGLGPVNFIAQNGIQFGFGGLGQAKHNTVSGTIYTPQTFASGGILLFVPGDGVEISENKVEDTDVGIWLAGADLTEVRKNQSTNATFDAIALDDQGIFFGFSVATTGNTISENEVEDSGTGIGLYGVSGNVVEGNEASSNSTAGFVLANGFTGARSTGNSLSQNEAEENDGDGFLMEGDDNVVEENEAKENGGIGIAVDGAGNVINSNEAEDNGVSDIQNTGANAYADNECDSSSGPPVDCGASPSFDHVDIEGIPAAQPVS